MDKILLLLGFVALFGLVQSYTLRDILRERGKHVCLTIFNATISCFARWQWLFFTRTVQTSANVYGRDKRSSEKRF